MRYVEEFRDPTAAKSLLAEIEKVTNQIGATKEKPVHIMEICGGHTHAIFRYGLDRLTPEGIEFIHGPGCPVCVLPMSRVDECVQIAEKPNVIFTTFGDAMRVPGTKKSLLQAKADGADIRMVYSPLDALELARRNPDKEVVFFGLGFETTTPSTALSIQQAARDGLTNFSVFCNHITVPEPIKALLDDPYMMLDGFVGPGHVSMVIGVHPYDFIARDYGKPIVVAGFEPLDLLQSVLMVLTQIRDGRAEVENQYARIVPEHGNPISIAAINDEGGLQYSELEEEISNYHLNNIMNGLAPSMLINFNNGTPNEEERTLIEQRIYQKFSGSSNAGKFILAFNDDPAQQATIEPIQESFRKDQHPSPANVQKQIHYASNLGGCYTQS